jgi:hypothetical protein
VEFHNIGREAVVADAGGASPVGDETLVLQWGERFREDRLAARIVADLALRADDIWHLAFASLQRESPEYRNAVDEEFASESKGHCNELLRTIVAIAARRKLAADPFAFIRTHAEWRARHQVPLIASLHAYRLAHRTYWSVTRKALAAHEPEEAALRSLGTLSDFWIELFDRVSDVLAEAHAAEERRTVAQNTRAYAALIDDLLRGVLPEDAETRQLCALCGIRPGTPLAVIVARPLPSAGNKPEDREVTLRSLARLIEQALPPAQFGKLVDIAGGEVRAIACAPSDVGRGALEALRRNGSVRAAADGAATGLGGGFGAGCDRTEIAALPQSLEEARLALQLAGPGERLKHFSDIDLGEFLVRRADSAAYRLIPDWIRHVGPADDRSRELGRTVRAFADCDLNVKQTAQRLGVHANTIYFRLNRIAKLTGLDPRSYTGTTRLLTALRLAELREAASAGSD